MLQFVSFSLHLFYLNVSNHVMYLVQGQMTDGKCSIHDAVNGAGIDSDNMVITLEHLRNTEQTKNSKNPQDEQLIQSLF